MGPKISFKNGLKGMINEINDWKNAPLWTLKKLKKQHKFGLNTYLNKTK